MVVDYLTRFIISHDKENAFHISMLGAQYALIDGGYIKALKLLENVKGLDDNSIVCACKLTSFDVWYRNPVFGESSPTYEDINPDQDTIENIRILVERSINFFDKYGPITKDGFTFEPNGYTSIVTSGDGDFLTKDTLWDFKVSKNKPTSKHTLQLLMYWIMGKHSGQDIFDDINKIGIFNPRLNEVYVYVMDDLSKSVLDDVSKSVVGYDVIDDWTDDCRL